MWSFQIHETISGNLLARVDPSAGSWRRALGEGSGSHTLQLRDSGYGWTPAVARAVSEPNATTFVVAWDDAPVYAGLVQDTEYSRDTGELVIGHVEGFRALLRDRNTFGVSGYPTGDLTVSGRSPSGVVRAILARATSIHGVSSRGELPVDLPADSSGELSYAWKNYEWHRCDDLLKQVEGLGYEIEFEPYFDSAGGLRWATRIASRLSAPMVEVAVSADSSPVSDLRVRRDGAKQISGCFYLGKGSEADMVWAESSPPIMGTVIPVRDAVRSAKDVDDVAKLARVARADRDEHREPLEQWGFKLTYEPAADSRVSFGALRTGATLRLWLADDDFISDGAHDMRLIGLSGDMSWTVTPEVQPV